MLWFALISLTFPSELSPEHQKLEFLTGTWRTESVWPSSGLKVTGELSFEWVLGGSWLKFSFRGDHPERAYWEAHGMIQWQEKTGSYHSIAFWDASGPHTVFGRFVDEDTVCFSPADGRSGIDYRATETGVYQENWQLDEDDRRIVTLQTTYTRR